MDSEDSSSSNPEPPPPPHSSFLPEMILSTPRTNNSPSPPDNHHHLHRRCHYSSSSSIRRTVTHNNSKSYYAGHSRSGMSVVAAATLVVLLTALWLPSGVEGQQQDRVPIGAASLAFVFDITGSMYDDLVQVIEGAAKILATALFRREKPLYNYVLVPFHDPEVGPVLVTTDHNKFQRALRDLYVQGGGDCPEMSIGAIKKALEVSLPNSFIYVFTDARSKDFYLTEEVLALIQQKQSQVVFVLTGDCGNVTHRGYRAFEEIAATSSGQVFLLKKSQVNQVLNFVRVAVQARKVNLLSIDEEVGTTQVLQVPIDSKLQEFTVSVSGENPKIILKDPSGARRTKSSGVKELLSIKNVQIVNVKNPTPGTWRFRVGSSSPHSVRVTGLSTTDFAIGFSKYPTRDFSDTRLRPVQGVPTHVLINATNVDHPARLSNMELVDLRGRPIAKFPMVQDPQQPSLYNVTSFIPPDQFFYVRVTGKDEKGYALQRITPTAISPQAPKAPSVFMPDVTKGFYDQTAVLTCKVHSLVPYTVQWFRDDKQQGFDLFFSDSANVTLEVPRASTYSEGEYVCNASNVAGSQTARTYLDISDPPPVIVPPTNVSVLPGETAVLTCVAFSTVQYNMTWHRHGHRPRPVSSYRGSRRRGDIQLEPTIERYLLRNPRMRWFNNGSLVIRNVQTEDEGLYECEARNEGGIANEKVSLRIQVRPISQVFPAEQTFVLGSTRNFSCQGGGHPMPRFLWQREKRVMIPSQRISIQGGQLSIRDLRRSDEGTYECVATNIAGEDYSYGRLIFTEGPKIREYERKVLVAVGDQARLRCIAEGIPKPNITWYRSDRMLQTAYNVEVHPSGELLINNVQDLDAGLYKCVATNDAGSDSATVSLEVGSPPQIVEPPVNVGIEIEGNGTLPCSAVGSPPPKISWRRGDGRPLATNGKFQQHPIGELTISDISVEDEGLYTCVAQNPFGKNEASAFVTVTGIVRPLISYNFPFIKVIAGETAELECNVLLGKPRPRLTWQRKGQQLRQSQRVRLQSPGRLVISDAREEDDGEYMCVASNIGGNATYILNLDVLVPPKLSLSRDSDRRRNFTVVQGRRVVLPCSIEGDPPPSYSWFKDGSPISPVDVHYFVRQDGSLEIFSADVQDTAAYKCVASNVAGEVEKDMFLFVQVGPQLEGPEEEKFEVMQGESILLPCEISGTPRPTVQWRQNFSPFNPQAARFQFHETGLYIQNAQVDDKAIYECVASNTAGNVTKVITLIVYIPPTLAPGETDMTVLEGKPAILTCEANGDPFPKVMWRRGGVIFDPSDSDRGYYIGEAGTLAIEAARLADAGEYTCTASNPAGEVSRDIRLTVNSPPRLPPTLSGYTEVVEGNPVILPCPAVGSPRPHIIWTKDGVALSISELGVRFLEDGSLEIDDVEAADSGAYQCLARNVAGNVSHIVDLKILVPPRLTGPDGSYSPDPTKPTVLINTTVTMTCPVSRDTDPPPVLIWYKDNVPLRENDLGGRLHVRNGGLSLTITEAQLVDEARYRCNASNVAGSVHKDFDLEVQVPPSINEDNSSPTNQTVAEGQTAHIDCQVSGKPPPRVTWLKEGEPLSPELDPNVRLVAEGRRLEILSAKVTDRGTYTCVGESVAGEVAKDFNLDVYVPPSVENPGVAEEAEAVVGNDLRLNCPAFGIPLPRVMWFQQDVAIRTNSSKHVLENEGWTLLIRQATPEDARRYFCRAENIAGEAEKTFNVEILVPPKVTTNGKDLNPEVIVNATAIINCPARGNPQPEIQWFRNNVPLDATNNPRYEIVGGGRQLRVHLSQVKDRGLYRCTARNRAGDDAVDFTLDVYVPPQIEIQGISYDNKVIANNSITIYCPASGVPPPIILWYKDGEELDVLRDDNLDIRAGGTELLIRRAKVVDSGQYSCLATNPAGEAEDSFNLGVQVPPTIPSDGLELYPRVIENSTVFIDCPAIGVPDPQVLWFHNNQPIDVETANHVKLTSGGRRLEIHSAVVGDTGMYRCIATNEAGEADQQFELQVWVPPVITDDLLDPNPRVIKGQTATLDCPVYGIPFPNVTWLREGRDLPTSDPRVRVTNGGVQLQILNAIEEDTGKYSCLAENPAGSDRANFDFKVLVRPTIDESNVVYNPKTIADRWVVLECPVSGIPVPEVEWLLNGEPLVQTERLKLINNNRQLEIDSARTSDTGLYTCIATNEAGQLERNFDLEVQVPPVIDREAVQDQLTVVQNNSISIGCPVSGVPTPSIIWFKDEAPLLDWPYRDLRVVDNDRTLEVLNAQQEDAGTYSCLATNPAGQDEVDFSLQVFVAPQILQPGSDKLSVVEGSSVSMQCQVSGIPQPSLLWLHNSEALQQTSDRPHLTLLSNDTLLQLTDVRTEHAGKYTCHAENQAGFADKVYLLDVWVPPTINGSDTLQNIPVILNEPVRLPCPVEGVPTPEITWYRKGRQIPDYGAPNLRIVDNGQMLVVQSAQFLDFGDYSCQAVNPAGQVQKTFRLTVQVPPEIAEGPDLVAASVNTQSLLPCESSGQPTPIVQWMKDGEPFPSSGLRHRTTPSGSLEFMLVRLEDGGRYMCVVSNPAGNVSRAVTLQVQVPAKILTRGRPTVRVPRGQSVMLPCETEGSPKPSVYWLKDRAVLEENANHRMLENGSLLLSNLRLRDAGVFTCIAQNNAGIDNRDIRLRVQIPPKISVGQREYTVLQNRTIVLPCQASGRPRPKIRWERNGQKISSSDYRIPYGRVHYITLHTGGLAIPHVRADDGGVYRCVAQNKAGESYAEITLTVQIPPMIEEASQTLIASVGDRTVIPCVTMGNPPPTITWHYDRRRINPRDPKYTLMDDGSLVINSVTERDMGSYICYAQNIAGRDSQGRLLRVQVPPRLIHKPRDQEVTLNSRFELECVARGVPVPVITWMLNGRPLAAPPSVNGVSTVTVRHAMQEDGGEYTCVATNPANDQQVSATARVIIKVPPRVIVPPGDRAVRIAEKVILDCSVAGDPPPEILWTKNGRSVQLSERIRQLSNGSLVIYDLLSSDAGEYKCIAINDAGTSEAQSIVTVTSEPNFLIEPKSQTVDEGQTVTFDCTAEGQPRPEMYWWKETTELESQGRVTILPNNSLRIVATQLNDTGLYRCFASNPLGKTFVETVLNVVVHGRYSDWGNWGECSATCGQGIHYRTRTCDSPQPMNGGRDCVGERRESASCQLTPCPEDGEWGNWQPWSSCSVSCGAGQRQRQRRCDNPPPQPGGRPCEGDDVQTDRCNDGPCPIDGEWGVWEPWGPCSLSCGVGAQQRRRQCNNPRPQFNGAPCQGEEVQQQPCRNQLCAVDGQWGLWLSWSPCSLSCGGGIRSRQRRCDNPRPQFSGAECMGPDAQRDYCNNEPCPVHGNWAGWGAWGRCSLTCGGGQRKRFRTCSNPSPSNNGRPCVGSAEDADTCNLTPCPVEGWWQEWSVWSECSRTCDGGTQERRRVCQPPQHGGRPCLGDSTEVNNCNTQPCSRQPQKAEGNLIGYVNNVDIVDATIVVTVIPGDRGTKVTGVVRNVPPEAANHLQHLISLLNPVYWTTAREVDGAVNGYTLTGGEFMREIQVEFATGEILKMSHYANGVDRNGMLTFDIIIRGEVPDLGPIQSVYLAPYREQYIQTGPGTIYAHSTRLMTADGLTLPYAWNHTITYEESLGHMPYLVQELQTEDMTVEVMPDQQSVTFTLQASIQPGNPSNQCPLGFTHDEQGAFCQDDDECTRLSPCSHYCHNAPGSFSCSCPVGYSLSSDAHTCEDINECISGAECPSNQECLNTLGSYQCAVVCGDGFRRSQDGSKCEDVNECVEQPSVCEQSCQNLVGSYRCSCGRGFRLGDQGRCVDVNECEGPSTPCSHDCVNTPGSYRCACPAGYRLTAGRACRDINECYEGSHRCEADQECINSEGSYECVQLCPRGFVRTASGQCQDVDECSANTHRCYRNQRCINTNGGYRCQCPKGYRSRGIGEPCVDIDECRLRGDICQHNCTNTQGSYTCSCPQGYRLAADGYSCTDINECWEERIQCGQEQMCFNTRGSYSCIDIPCPTDYIRDPSTNFCVLECVDPGTCPPGSKYADVIQFRTVALPGGIPARQDLIRLTAYNQHDEMLPETTFTLLENDPKLTFYLRPDNGKGIVYTLEKLVADSYRIMVRAKSYDRGRQFVQYQTTFIIHIAVSLYPY
ncbi:hemicentin-1-like isoform X2 [Babylonia areolata]|uniref:hemicentin-1-like isoform X2 n=1 Tax=Babylonia areolata TaxID=304850 RepID=UPI003FD347C2